MQQVVEADDVCDPRSLTVEELTSEIRRLSADANNEHDAEEAIRQRFLPKPQVWVQRRGEYHWAVLIQLGPGEDNRSIIVRRT